MAKLLAARVAWTAADNSLQIHGGNGFALEYEIRAICDARILNIFEGLQKFKPKRKELIKLKLIDDKTHFLI